MTVVLPPSPSSLPHSHEAALIGAPASAPVVDAVDITTTPRQPSFDTFELRRALSESRQIAEAASTRPLALVSAQLPLADLAQEYAQGQHVALYRANLFAKKLAKRALPVPTPVPPPPKMDAGAAGLVAKKASKLLRPVQNW